MKHIKIGAVLFSLILSACLSSVLSFNQTRITDECLKGMMLSDIETLKCVTERGVSIQMVKTNKQIFYCIKYEKKTGSANTYDLLSFDLKEDYDLKFTGANVASNDETSPQFKLYDTRLKPYYRGKFAFYSVNKDFDINNVSVNEEEQFCVSAKKQQIWPKTFAEFEPSTVRVPTTMRIPASSRVTTTMKPPPAMVAAESNPQSSCGTIRKTDLVHGFFAFPSMPGQFPWNVAIYRYIDEEEPYYKCSGTIIDGSTVLTSATCLLEDGFILKPDDLQIYVSPFSLSTRRQKFKIYNVDTLKIHEYFAFHAEHNIAIIKLKSIIEFNDYVQPICLPAKDKLAVGKLGKFAGFGKSTSAKPPKSDLLTEAEYQITSIAVQTFSAENTSGNSKICDIGGGFYSNETNRWVLSGILSKKPVNDDVVLFTRVDFYLDWIAHGVL